MKTSDKITGIFSLAVLATLVVTVLRDLFRKQPTPPQKTYQDRFYEAWAESGVYIDHGAVRLSRELDKLHREAVELIKNS